MSDKQIIDGILYRKAVPEMDDEKVLLLYNYAFNRTFSMEWFRWFNYSCPFGPNRLYIAEDQTTSSIVGSWGLLPYKVKFNDEVIGGSLASNLVTHPCYRRRGIFANVVKFALAQEERYGSKISLNAPNKLSEMGLAALRGYLKVGFEIISDLDFIITYNNKPEQFKATKVGRFSEKFDLLLSTSIDKMKFAVFKDHRFLNWRYFDRPDQEYHVYAYQDENTVLDFIVLKYFEENGYKKAHILDIYAINEYVFNDLLNVAKSFAFTRNCQELNCWQIRNSPYAPWFYKRGFELSANKYALMLSNNFGVKEVLISQDWWFALGDNDVY